MEAKDLMSLPFLTRKMLNFDFAAKFTLQVRYNSSVAGSFFVTGATRNGTFSYKVMTNGTNVSTTLTFPVDDIPLWISAYTTDATQYLGGLYVEAALLVNNTLMQIFTAGYVSPGASISYPKTDIQAPMPGIKLAQLYTGADPDAGEEWYVQVPAGQLWEIVAISATLVTDATVSNRKYQIDITSQSTIIAKISYVTAQTATDQLTYIASVWSGGVPPAFGIAAPLALPQDLWVGAGDELTSATENMQAGDNWSTAKIFYRPHVIF